MRPDFFEKVILLDPDTSVPEERTPWGGRRLYGVNGIKSKAVASKYGAKVGESWEFSLDPQAPSYLLGTKVTLLDLVSQHPEEICGPGAKREDVQLLLKLLDADQPLSLQVHPEDTDPFLKPHECGKPESWLVLAREQGAGLYLGFKKPMGKDELRQILLKEDRAKDYLQFVPVEVGDYFEIQPGVVHAIGPGVTLLEPQRVLPGKEGKTFRLWDWGRLYGGKPRELHLEESLRIIDPERDHGIDFVSRLRRSPQVRQSEGFSIASYPENETYQVHLIKQRGPLRLSMVRGYGAILILDGALQVGSDVLKKGQNALLPFKALPLKIEALEESNWALVTSKGSQTRWNDE